MKSILKLLDYFLSFLMIVIIAIVAIPLLFILFIVVSEYFFPGLDGVHYLGDDLYTLYDDDGRLMIWYSPDIESKVPDHGTPILPRSKDYFSIRLDKIERIGNYIVGFGKWEEGDSVFCYVDESVINKLYTPGYKVDDDIHYTSSRDSLMLFITDN